jgi:membrane protein
MSLVASLPALGIPFAHFLVTAGKYYLHSPSCGAAPYRGPSEDSRNAVLSKLKEIGSIALEAVRSFFDENPFQLAAALSYYTLLSMAPLLLVLTGAAGLLLNEEQVREALVDQVRDLVGDEGASLLRTVARNAGTADTNVISMSIGFVLMLIGATTVFAQLQTALNRIWQVKATPSNALLGFLRARLVSLAVVLGLSFLLLVSLVFSAAVSGLQTYIESFLPGGAVVWTTLNDLISLTLVALLLAMLFRYVPDVEISWRDTLIGALVTAVLLTLGKHAIGLYLGRASVGSPYGAAGSAVVFMVWVYFASLILFLGAMITKVIARHRGSPLIPSEHATAI